MDADPVFLERAEQLIRELVARNESPVASVSCTRADGDDLAGAVCEVLLVDGRKAACVIDVEERRGAYFVMPQAERPEP
jgi:hypothetical protein